MSVDPNISILLVEDSGIMRKMEMSVLKSVGFNNVVEAEDGNDAIFKLESNPIDIVLSDWNMPNMSGYDLLIWVRNSNKFSKLPFVMATGRGEKKEIAKASKAGVSSFITKPFGPEELKAKIEEAFSEKKAENLPEAVFKPQYGASGKPLIKIAHIQITDHIILGALKHLIDSGKISPKNFELETQCMSSWNPVAKALEDKTIEGAFVLAPIAMDLFAYGTKIKLVLFAHKGGSIIVKNRKGEKFRKPYENYFKNKSFYIPHTMSIHNMMAHMFFSNIGLKPGVAGDSNVDVSFEVTPPVKMPEFLSNNENACGFMVAEPIGTKSIAGGIAEQIGLSSELWENHPCCVVAIQEEFIERFPDAVQELTECLVEAGQFVDQKPGIAAEVGVAFLDPKKILGLRVPLLKNVLSDPLGIKTNDLYPVKADLEKIQRYLHDKMNLGSIIDLNKFVDLRFADQACQEGASSSLGSIFHEGPKKSLELLDRLILEQENMAAKSTLDKVGKYLTLSLGEREFGIDISKIREIIGITTFRTIPNTPQAVRGVINLRGRVISIVDLRLKLNMPEIEYNDRTCIIVIEIQGKKGQDVIGVVVDAVSEVSNVKAEDIEEPPNTGLEMNTDHILAMAKNPDNASVKILLDIDRILTR
ncbi:response regulator receiver modulated CheW protein [Candidatus Magnetomorum sp. HK-1]|nr:response regulator receiver modulated CheW protein [Candidatus Magnetomorum sp. HK-1]